MRELLERWAKLEPDRCEKSSKKPLFTIRANEDEKNILDSDELSSLELAWIQWAVQAAIVSRGWYFSLSFHPLRAGYRAEVGGKRKWAEESTEAFLSAYLAALEVAK